MSVQIQAVQYGDTKLEYRVVRSSKRRLLAITVEPDSSVLVRAPTGTRIKVIDQRILSKADWVIRIQDEFKRFSKPCRKEFVSGETFSYLGRYYRLKVCPVGQAFLPDTSRAGMPDSPAVKMYAGFLIVYVPATLKGHKRSEKVREGLIAWYKARARIRFPDLSAKCAKKLGVTYQRVEINEMRLRWASTSKSGIIRYNWRTIMAPIRLVEYVVAHEVCHLKHPDHSRAFERSLSSLLPDWNEREHRLATVGCQYSW